MKARDGTEWSGLERSLHRERGGWSWMVNFQFTDNMLSMDGKGRDIGAPFSDRTGFSGSYFLDGRGRNIP